MCLKAIRQIKNNFTLLSIKVCETVKGRVGKRSAELVREDSTQNSQQYSNFEQTSQTIAHTPRHVTNTLLHCL